MAVFAPADAAILDARRGRTLFMHRFLVRLAQSAGNVFAWIIVFRLFYLSTSLETALAGTASLYALSHAITFFLTPLAGIALRRGVRRALFYGTLACSGSFSVIAAIFYGSVFHRDDVFWMIALFAVLHGIYRALYFVPYKTAESESLARSPFVLAREGAVALMPALSGYILAVADNGPFLAYAGITIVLGLAALMLLRMPESHEPYSWSYLETFSELLSPRNSLAVGLYILDGIQGAALLLVWPLAAFLLLDQSFQSLGAVLTATLCIAFLARWIVRKLLRAINATNSPLIISSIVFSSWILRLGAASPVQILAVDLYYNSGNSPRRFSIDSYAHEQSADGGHFVDEYTAIKEMSLSIGRIALSILFIVVMLSSVESLAFAAAILTAAIAGAWSVFIANRLQRQLV